MLKSIGKQSGDRIHVVSPEEEKGGYGGKGSQIKRAFKPGMKQ